MKIALVSDLHIDASEQSPIDLEKWPEADVLVVAGDTSNKLETSFEFIQKLAQRYPHVVTVDGNHEHWHNGKMQRTVDEAITQAGHLLPTNVHFLHPEKPTVEINGVHFVGCNGWYSGDASGDPEENKIRFKTWSDCRFVGFSFLNQDYPMDRARNEAEIIERTLDDIAKTEEGRVRKPVVVVTHTVPHRELAHWIEHDPEWNRTNSFFVNTHMQPLLDRDDITAWVYGHTHHRKDRVVGKTYTLANPKGHSGENPNWEVVGFNVIM